MNGWQGLSAYTWGASDINGNRVANAAAGWNICSKAKKEYGFFETVCIFDGDIFVEGLPYRTAELDPGSGVFGTSKDVELFGGEWELRLAYANFSWGHLSGSSVTDKLTTDIAFPAVRGEVCRGTGKSKHCKSWSPCHNGFECRCSYFQGDRFCFEDNWEPKQDGEGGWSNWRSKMCDMANSVATLSSSVVLAHTAVEEFGVEEVEAFKKMLFEAMGEIKSPDDVSNVVAVDYLAPTSPPTPLPTPVPSSAPTYSPSPVPSSAPSPLPTVSAVPTVACAPVCFGQACDYWSVYGYTCSTMENYYGCDCGGCDCGDTGNNDYSGSYNDYGDDYNYGGRRNLLQSGGGGGGGGGQNAPRPAPTPRPTWAPTSGGSKIKVSFTVANIMTQDEVLRKHTTDVIDFLVTRSMIQAVENGKFTTAFGQVAGDTALASAVFDRFESKYTIAETTLVVDIDVEDLPDESCSKFHTYPEDVNKKYLGDWWRLNDTVPAGFKVTLNDSFIHKDNMNDDKWNAWASCASAHTLILDGSPIDGWNGATFSVRKCTDTELGRKCLELGPKVPIQGDSLPLMEGSSREAGSVTFFLCPDDQYIFEVQLRSHNPPQSIRIWVVIVARLIFR